MKRENAAASMAPLARTCPLPPPYGASVLGHSLPAGAEQATAT